MSDTAAVGDQQQQQRPWASPRQQPVKGIVQPRVLPPFGKPTRHTNKLDYIMNTVLKEASKHKHVWPFQKPVDALTLCIPLYHERIARPMDLKTIENRLKSTYYTCAQECIDDIETVFNNCYVFNGREDDVTIMAQNVHEVIKKSLENAPRDEHDMDVYWGKNKKKGKAADSKSSSGSEKKKELRGPSEARSECGSEASGIEKAERKPAGKKTVKRKAESDEDEKTEPQRTKREAATKKDPHHTISPIMKPCLKLLNEFYNKKYHEISWPFHEPVDAEGLGLHDYHKIVKEPMDMRTIKRKLESCEYKDPTEFERDMKLMLNNCLLYNPMFEKKWATLGDSSSRASSVGPSATAPVLTSMISKFPKTAVLNETKKEIKKELMELSGSSSEDFVQINNALRMINEREEMLRLELEAATRLKEKLRSVKARREENPSEPFPDKLIIDARMMCTSNSLSTVTGTPSYKNGKGKKANTSKMYEFDSDDEENRKVMSYEDKRGLSVMINRLPPTHLSTIISIIQRRENSAIDKQQQAESEIEIDFESLGDMCLREMDAFVRSVLNIKKNEDDMVAPKLESVPAEDKNPVANRDEKKKKGFNMSESSDDETSNSRKRRKKDSSESESSTSSDDESEDDIKNVPRKSGQPPSTSREWNHGQPQPRIGGMGGQPPTSRVPPSVSLAKVATVTSNHASKASTRTVKQEKGAAVAAKSNEKISKKAEVVGKSILDKLLPDTFGTTQGNADTSCAPSELLTSRTMPADQLISPTENGENEEARIQRMRMEAKRAREREDENSVSMVTQMEMMTAFEFNNLY
ncbi:unnamed protein product [Caenorhabditis sp. 36 PRJEB53466]|nr:unnamed protein product [Caenorhabditis sp. 36 PRJEB53466]